MKIVFIGSVLFSSSMLHELLRMNANVVGICTAPVSSWISDQVDLSVQGFPSDIPILKTTDVNASDSVEWIRRLEPDLIFCLGWSRLIKNELLQLAPLVVIGYHPTALPLNRGRHPLIWTLALGLKETASTFFFIDKGIDSGDIISQEPVMISEDDDANILYERLTEVARDQLWMIVKGLSTGVHVRRIQNHALANYWRKRDESDGKIDWRLSALTIHKLIRALSKPYSGAPFHYSDTIYKVWKSEVIPGQRQNIEPGKVLDINSTSIVVKAGHDAVRLIQITPWPQLQIGHYL